MKFFADGLCDPVQQFNKLTPLLRAQLEMSAEERRAAGSPICIQDIGSADFVTPPKIWGAYVNDQDLKEPLALARRAERAGKPFLVWHTGDLTPVLPSENWMLLMNAADRSERKRNWYVAPRFIDDPLTAYGQEVAVAHTKPSRPRIGFCGYAASSPIKLGYSVLQNLKFHAMYHARRTMYEPPRLIPATLLRAKVLEQLKNSSEVDTNFIIRTRYRAGSAEEFYTNILTTDYTVCVRGYGNWSVRLYETLACGRIPILIDTDCGLPFDSTIDWRHYCVWVPEKDVGNVSDYVMEFHSRLPPKDFRARQCECRAFWEDRLTLKGFLAHLHEYFAISSSNPAPISIPAKPAGA